MNKELPKVLEELSKINEEKSYVSFQDVALKVKEYGLTPKDVKVLYKDLNEHNIVLKDVVEEKSKEGCQIVIAGNPVHPEVVGIVGWSIDGASVVKDAEEAQKLVLDPKKPVFVAAQTTFHYIKFQNIVDQLEKKEYNINCVNTICNATRNRQEEAARLAASVDGMLVIGGSHSSNTQKLFEICKKECNNTHYIQTAEDLDTNWFLTADRVGVTGGASTPNIIIEEVLHHVRRIRTIIK